jgi:hypothetical protein
MMGPDYLIAAVDDDRVRGATGFPLPLAHFLPLPLAGEGRGEGSSE